MIPEARRRRIEREMEIAVQRVFAQYVARGDAALVGLDKALAAAVRKYIEDAHRLSILILLLSWGMDDDVEPSILQSERFARERADQLGRDVLAGSREKLERLGRRREQEQAAEGRTQPASGEPVITPEDLRRVLPPERARRIAVTETTAANEAGDSQGAQRLQIRGGVRRIWVTREDERVCPQCQALHGMTEDEWVAASGVLGPPLHVNCRCEIRTRLYVPPEAAVRP